MKHYIAIIIVLLSAGYAQASEKAYFAGGCFWCMEADFSQRPGIVSVTSGYSGGSVENPTYQQIASGSTGHAEAVEVVYDSAVISYEKLLEIYWDNIDPTDKGGQFADRGTQYRTMIFYTNDKEKSLAAASKKRIETKLKQPVYTEITKATMFYPAEEYHQDYYLKNPVHYNAYKYGSGRVSRLKELKER
jgi:methionine-S-sulfoxide reductase